MQHLHLRSEVGQLPFGEHFLWFHFCLCMALLPAPTLKTEKTKNKKKTSVFVKLPVSACDVCSYSLLGIASGFWTFTIQMFYVPFVTVVALFKILLCRSGKENYFKLVKTPSSRVVSFKIISQNSAPTNQKFFTNEFLETGNIAQLLKNVAVKKFQT